MKLKRITAALLAGVMCVGLLAGCGSKGDGDEKGSGDNGRNDSAGGYLQ